MTPSLLSNHRTVAWIVAGFAAVYAVTMTWISMSALYSLTSKPSMLYSAGLLAAFGAQLSALRLKRPLLGPLAAGAAIPVLALLLGWLYVHLSFPADAESSTSTGDLAQIIMLLAAASAAAAAIACIAAFAGRKLQSAANVPAGALFGAASCLAAALVGVAAWKYPYL